MILEQIYEVDFHDTSFGFRPRRSCHQALSVLGQNIATQKVNWISDADIKGFFDTVCHERLDELLRIRISDPKLLALINRFLKDGVIIEGQRFDTEDGVPQGASLSPLLANVYLHYVLDKWFERDVKPRMQGEASLIRYADDFIVSFELESDAMKYQSVLPKRLARFSLSVAEDKTKLIRFGRFARRDCQRRGSADLRLPRIHSLLRAESRRSLQTEKEDVDEEASWETAGPESLVLEATLDSDSGDMAHAEREAPRSLSVLRHQ